MAAVAERAGWWTGHWGEGCGGVAGTLGVPSRPKSLGRVCGALGGLNRGFSLGPIVATGAVEAERWEEER